MRRRAVNVPTVSTYADAVHYINLQAKNKKWSMSIIQKMISSEETAKGLSDKQIMEAFELADIPIYDIQSPMEWTFSELDAEEDDVFLLHRSSKKELKAGIRKLREDISQLYRLKCSAVQVLNPPVVGKECIRGKYYAIVNIEDRYYPHVPIDQKLFFKLKSVDSPKYCIKKNKHKSKNGKPFNISQKDFCKSVEMLLRLTDQKRVNIMQKGEHKNE